MISINIQYVFDGAEANGVKWENLKLAKGKPMLFQLSGISTEEFIGEAGGKDGVDRHATGGRGENAEGCGKHGDGHGEKAVENWRMGLGLQRKTGMD